jgi:hypothetical protein
MNLTELHPSRLICYLPGFPCSLLYCTTADVADPRAAWLRLIADEKVYHNSTRTTSAGQPSHRNFPNFTSVQSGEQIYAVGDMQLSPVFRGNSYQAPDPVAFVSCIMIWESDLMLRSFCLFLMLTSPAVLAQAPATTQVKFAGPAGMEVRWFVKSAVGKGGYPGPPLVAPGRYNFKQGYTYRLKLSHISGYPGLELYPTLEVPVAGPGAWNYLAHNVLSLELTDDDLHQVKAGKYLIKTIHLPGAGGPAAGPKLLILRLGNLDAEMHSPLQSD